MTVSVLDFRRQANLLFLYQLNLGCHKGWKKSTKSTFEPFVPNLWGSPTFEPLLNYGDYREKIGYGSWVSNLLNPF